MDLFLASNPELIAWMYEYTLAIGNDELVSGCHFLLLPLAFLNEAAIGSVYNELEKDADSPVVRQQMLIYGLVTEYLPALQYGEEHTEDEPHFIEPQIVGELWYGLRLSVFWSFPGRHLKEWDREKPPKLCLLNSSTR